MKTNYRTIIIVITFLAAYLTTAVSCKGANPSRKQKSFNLTRAQVIKKTLKPYRGRSVKGVDTSTMTGKVLCGYQGWFACKGDGSGRGWIHYEWSDDDFEPGRCSIDLWPDVSELDKDEKYPTAFRHADGSIAYVFSSFNKKTVLRHFKWMRDYGIDGAFVQRFGCETLKAEDLNHATTVLASCRAGANTYGRTYAVMYDLTNLKAGQTEKVKQDWALLVDRMKLTRNPNDKAYLHHNGKPVVAVWGIGFNGREYTLKECADLVEFLKNDKKYGGNTVMLGLPTFWRTSKNDAVADPFLHQIVLKADIVSPWMVGRFARISQVSEFANNIWVPDIKWCKENGKDYLPVVWPGFSVHNLLAQKPFNEIPRHSGRFLWEQFTQAKMVGAKMIYVAMFDELDEATAIFKCTNKPPIGPSSFLKYDEGNAEQPDHYLWLVSQAAKFLRGETSADFPQRKQ